MLLYIIAVVFAYVGFNGLVQQNWNQAFNLVVALLLVLVGRWWRRRKKKNKVPQFTPNTAPSVPVTAVPAQPAAAPQTSVLSFRIAGTSFNGRQTTLRKIDEGVDDKYIGCSFGIEETEYKGEPAYSIYVELMDDNSTHKQLGFVPAKMVPNVQSIYDRITYVDVDVYGGGDDKNYGASATLTFRI